MIHLDSGQGGKGIGEARRNCQPFQFCQFLRGKRGIACARYEYLCQISEQSGSNIKGRHTGLLSKKPKFVG